MRVGIIDLLTDTAPSGWRGRIYARYYRKQFMSIMPQAVAVWCRELGHRVHYATYWGQCDPLHLLPAELDVVFVAAYTQASALAYALAIVFGRRGATTVIGGPHAKSFPTDCRRYFDIVVKDCDKTLIKDILDGQFDPPAVVTSGRPLADFPSVEERLPEIATASFHHGRPLLTSLVPLLSSVGCPYACDFCVDWNSQYVVVPPEKLREDLAYLSRHWPQVLVGFHDPNFAIRFDQTMDTIETLPGGRSNPYIMESSLSILKESRLARLRRTNCVYVAPGIESWTDYSNKAGTGANRGRAKLEHVLAHLRLLARYIPGVQANLLFGGEADSGDEPALLTREMILRLPEVWPTINIPTPYSGTPLYDRLYRDSRILKSMPFAFYYNPYLAITLKNYAPIDYYDRLIDLHAAMTSQRMLLRRLSTDARPAIRFVHTLRTIATRNELAEFRAIRRLLVGDARFRAFHEARSDALPDYYHALFDRRLGRYAELIPRRERAPVLEPPLSSGSATGPAERALSLTLSTIVPHAQPHDGV
jgi:radical SAM superfamily enzyme YgiQ (UPF0313 family)